MTLPDFYDRLSATRTRAQFQAEVESCASQLGELSDSFYYLFSAEKNALTRQGELVELDQSTLPARCALYREEVFEDGVLCLPVRRFGDLVGVFMGVGKEQASLIGLRELLRVVGQVQDHVIGGEESRTYIDRSRDLMVQAVEALSVSPQHVKRVSQLCTELANLLDLSAQLRYELFQAAQYHDVGLLALQKNSREEAQRAHPVAGAEFLRSTAQLRHLATLVETHHERYDGSGFPKGLKGIDLPIDCWVLPLAEHLDEFWQRSPQPDYRHKLQAFFDSEVSTHHPDVIDALCGLSDSGRLEEIMG